jgi:hypothetical protein
VRTIGIREHDIVLVDRRGRRFEAIVSGREPSGRRISLRPLRPAIGYYSAGAREIVVHWRARPRSSGRASARPIRAGDVVRFRLGDQTSFGTVLARSEQVGSGLRVRLLERTVEPVTIEPAQVVRHYTRQGRRAARGT